MFICSGSQINVWIFQSVLPPVAWIENNFAGLMCFFFFYDRRVIWQAKQKKKKKICLDLVEGGGVTVNVPCRIFTTALFNARAPEHVPRLDARAKTPLRRGHDRPDTTVPRRRTIFTRPSVEACLETYWPPPIKCHRRRIQHIYFFIFFSILSTIMVVVCFKN